MVHEVRRMRNWESHLKDRAGSQGENAPWLRCSSAVYGMLATALESREPWLRNTEQVALILEEAGQMMETGGVERPDEEDTPMVILYDLDA